MKILVSLVILLFTLGCSESKKKPDIKSILLEQLENTHTQKDWFVPLGVAVDGLTVEQANWSDSIQNHSICELTSHLIFWNERILIAFQGNTPPKFDDNNEETFTKYCDSDWFWMVKKLDSIQTAWEQSVAQATNEQLKTWSSSIANISSHNAYHTGQIVYIRKKNNWWDASMGVK